MKFLLNVCAVMLIAVSTLQARTPLRVVTTKDAFLHVKMTTEMLGGKIEVRDSIGHVVSTKNIEHRSMYLDFFELADGTYNIKVQHDNVVVEISYTLESPDLHARRKHAHLGGKVEVARG